MKIALFGGSFDPVHQGHIKIACLVREQFGMDKIIFIPARVSPFKIGDTVTPPEDRINMLRIATEEFPEFEVSDFEINGGEVSFSYKTVEFYKDKHPRDEMFFIMGSDSYSEFHKWKHPKRIEKAAQIIVVSRGEMVEAERCLNIPEIKISSTIIREKVENGQDVTEYTGERVAEYIKTHSLYKGF